MNRINEFIQYHVDSSHALDIDPQVEGIQYLCNRFRLNMEQRCWLCFLFSTNYCVATTYYMFKEFPDFAATNTGKLQRWWDENRDRLIFQTDRAWVRSKNQFVDVFASYRLFVQRWSKGTMLQQAAISNAIGCVGDRFTRYDNLIKNADIAMFGRFTMFLYSELLHHVAGFYLGVRLDLQEAESSRNGLVFALGVEKEAYTGRTGEHLPQNVIDHLNSGLVFISDIIDKQPINPRHKTMWSIETTLCAYKKHKLGKRWVGFYIERMRKEIEKMQVNIPGIDWQPLWQFRTETYQKQYLP